MTTGKSYVIQSPRVSPKMVGEGFGIDDDSIKKL